MTDNRTTELREKLTERGVEWTSKPAYPDTTWLYNGWWHNAKFEPWSNSTFKVTLYDLTPEQAIAATLGSEREKELEELVQDVWRAYSAKAESSFHPAWEVDSELENRIKTLGM